MGASPPAPPSAAFSALRIVAALVPPALCLLAAELGHAFQPALAVCVALLVVGFPPVKAQPRWLRWAWPALALLPLLAFLPMPETLVPAWRAALAEELGIDLGRSFTPQPSALLAALVPFWTGLAWLWWACGQQWDALESKVLIRALVLTVAGLAGVVALSKFAGDGTLPAALTGGNAAFATRNQLATVLAIGFAAGIAIAFSARRNAPAPALLGLVAALLCAAAIAALGSRAGWLAAGAGAAAALAAVGWLRRSRTPIVAATILIIGGAAAIFLLPGETGDRLRQSLAGDSGGDFRFAVQRDALGVIAEQPWTGHGLGNFDGVFPFHRELSRSKYRAEHPESDLLWLAGEAGILLATLALVVAAALARSWLALARVEPHRGESAAAACGATAAILAHGLLDVPAHSMLAWLFAAGIAGAACGAPPHAPAHPPRPAIAWIVATVLVVSSGIVWRLIPSEPPRPFANDTPLDRIPDRAAIDTWLRHRPLDWRIVELRAHRAVADGRFDEARRDFDLLFRLEPFNPVVVGRSLNAWNRARRAPEFSEAVVELLRRIPPDELAAQVPVMTGNAAHWPELAAALATLDPPLSWQLHAMDFPDGLHGRTLARLCEILAVQDDVDTACRIALYQIAPQLGEEPPPPPWPRRPGDPERQSDDASHAESWYEVAVVQYLARNEAGAWRILRTYLAVKLPPEP